MRPHSATASTSSTSSPAPAFLGSASYMPSTAPTAPSASFPPTTSSAPSFSDVAADYAIPRAILAPHIMNGAPQPRLYSQQQLQHQHNQQRHRRVPTPPPAMHNPSVLHPVFFTPNFQRRRSFGQPAVPAAIPPPPLSPPSLHSQPPAPHHIHNSHLAPFSPYQSHPAFALPLAPPAPPLPHASSPVAHGYIYRENTAWPIQQRTRPVGIGTGSKL